jgi:hypothetical protein
VIPSSARARKRTTSGIVTVKAPVTGESTSMSGVTGRVSAMRKIPQEASVPNWLNIENALAPDPIRHPT